MTMKDTDHDKTIAELRELFDSLRELQRVFRGPEAAPPPWPGTGLGF